LTLNTGGGRDFRHGAYRPVGELQTLDNHRPVAVGLHFMKCEHSPSLP
jgi:hypothetical protein